MAKQNETGTPNQVAPSMTPNQTITLDDVLKAEANAVEVEAKYERFIKDAIAAVRRRDTYANTSKDARFQADLLKQRFETQLKG